MGTLSIFIESAEGGEVLFVVVSAGGGLSLGGFEDEGEFGDAGIGHQVSEGRTAYAAFGDVFVSIDTGVESGFGIVNVDDLEAREAYGVVELADGIAIGRRGSQVVPGGKDVAGVETDAEAVGAFDIFDDGGELIEAMAEAGTLAGGSFEQEPAVPIVLQDAV